MKNIDVAICVYGKPWQTALTLLSLLEHSGQHIDKIYLQEERDQPYGEKLAFLLDLFKDRSVIHFIPEDYLQWTSVDPSRIKDEKVRQSIRYQYAWEKTDKDFLFITHNDCLYTCDTIGGMLSRLVQDDAVGCGRIGQCWNCPASFAGACGPDKFDTYRPTYEEAVQIVRDFPGPRTPVEKIDRSFPMPFPECRLNEFGCLINVGKVRNIVCPNGDILPFGIMARDGISTDIGVAWFRELSRRGYKFVNWYDGMVHGWCNEQRHGHGADTNRTLYVATENVAKDAIRARYPDFAKTAGLSQ